MSRSMPAAVKYGNFWRNWCGWGDGRDIVFESGNVVYSGQELDVGAPRSLKIIASSSISPLA
jgi:hypothetical protein